MTKIGGGSSARGGATGDKTKALDDALDAIEASVTAPRASEAGKPAPHGVARKAPAAGRSAPAEDADPVMAAEVRWPYGFVMISEGPEAGAYFAPPGSDDKAPPPLWLSAPFKILGLCRTEGGLQWGKTLEFVDPDGAEKIIVIANADLVAGDAAAVRSALANAGLNLSARKATRDKLTEMLAGAEVDRRVTLRDRVGWGTDGSFYALPTETIGDGKHVILEPQAGGANFGAAGDLNAWKAWIGELVAPHDLPTFFTALALVGPLLEPLGAEGGGFHLVGPSSCGKSTALAVAVSAWRPPNSIDTWRATANALEARAAAHNDGLLPLDEIGLCDPRDVGIAAYVLAGGEGKQRMRSDGDMKAQRRWRIAVASTGEIGLSDVIGHDGRRQAMAGQQIRLIDLKIPPERRGGVFDGAGTPETFDALARQIKTAAGAAYGTVGPAFVRALVADRAGFVTDARRIMADFVRENVPAGAIGHKEMAVGSGVAEAGPMLGAPVAVRVPQLREARDAVAHQKISKPDDSGAILARASPAAVRQPFGEKPRGGCATRAQSPAPTPTQARSSTTCCERGSSPRRPSRVGMLRGTSTSF